MDESVPDRAAIIEALILKHMTRTPRRRLAEGAGVTEQGIEIFKTGGGLSRVSKILAACGLDVVPAKQPGTST